MCLCGGRCRGGGVGGGGSGDCSDGGDGGGGVDGSGGNSCVGDGGENGICRSGGAGGSVVHRSVGGGLCRSGWNFAVGCGFCDGGGGESGPGGRVCCEACCEAGSVVCEWEGIFFVLL